MFGPREQSGTRLRGRQGWDDEACDGREGRHWAAPSGALVSTLAAATPGGMH